MILTSNSNTTLDNLKDEMEDYIKSARSPYTSDPAQIVRGAHSAKQAVNKPFIGIYMLEDKIYQRMLGCNDIWEVTTGIYCYMAPESFGVYDKLHQMKDDIVYFLQNDSANRANTDVFKISLIEGGVITSVNYFELNCNIKYEYEI